MNQKALIAVVVGVLLAIGAGAFVLSSRSSNKTTVDGQRVVEDKKADDSSMEKSSLVDLMKLGANQKCTFNYQEAGGSGTMYVSGGKARSEFEFASADGTFASHMISDGTTVYIWTEGQKTGYKYSMSDLEKVAPTGTESGATQKSSVDVNRQVDYKCSAWIPDQTKFTPPSDVEFSDFKTIMEGNPKINDGTGTGTVDTTEQCKACDGLPEASKTQCRQALGC